MDVSLLLTALEDALTGAPLERGFARWDRQPPAPWRAWLLVCLARQIPRQQWLVRVVVERLLYGQPQSGEVPGLPGWRYVFHGIGCRFDSEDESLDVDFYDDGGLTIHPYFFAERVSSLAEPPLPEARLRELLPTNDLVARAIRELYPAGLAVLREDGNHVFRLHAELEALADRLTAVDFSDPATHEAFCVHLGDFEAASSATPERAASALRAYLDYLFGLLDAGDDAHLPLVPLGQLFLPEEFVDACAYVIRAPISRATGQVLKRLLERPELPYCPWVEELLDRLTPEEHHPNVMCGAAEYLLSRGVARERALAGLFAFAAVERVQGYLGNPMLADLALLVLEHAPEQALPLVRRALRSSTPYVQYRIGVALREIDEPWCHRELAQAAEEEALKDESDTAE